VEARVFQGIVDDAAAICGALLAELRVRRDLWARRESIWAWRRWAARSPRGRRGGSTPQAASRAGGPRGGARGDGGEVAPLSRVAAEVSETLEWVEDRPGRAVVRGRAALLEGERAGALRLWMDREPRRSLLRALRGLGHEAAAQLRQERERVRALRDLAAARQHRPRSPPPPRGCAARPRCPT